MQITQSIDPIWGKELRMKKRLLSIICLMLVSVMLTGALASCKTPDEGDDGTEGESQSENIGSESESESTPDESESTPDGGGDKDEPKLEGDHAALIENADALKNKVTAYFGDGNRTNVVYENLEMTLDYGLAASDKQQVLSLKNKAGNSYVENTMDVFVRMTDGGTYYASDSHVNGIFNIYRYGYYFYEMRVEEQDFSGSAEIKNAKKIDFRRANEKNAVSSLKFEDGVLKIQNETDAVDPWVVLSRDIGLDAKKYTVLEFTMK